MESTGRRADVDSDPSRIVVVFAGGAPVPEATARALPGDAHVIAADSGLDEVYRHGLTPDRVVGDLDSVSPQALQRARAAGVPVDEYPADKDFTDLELALDAALAAAPAEIVVVGGGGGRLSHLLGNALVLARSEYAGAAVTWHTGIATVQVAHPGTGVTVAGAPGDLVSLLPAGGPATGVTTTGLRWQLSGATLAPGSTRGISNEMTGAAATVTTGAGTVLVIHERTP